MIENTQTLQPGMYELPGFVVDPLKNKKFIIDVLSAYALVYFEFNITQDVIDMDSVRYPNVDSDTNLVRKNLELCQGSAARYVELWCKNLTPAEGAKYKEFFSLEHMRQCMEAGQCHLRLTHVQKDEKTNATIINEYSAIFYREEETGDVHAITYLINKTDTNATKKEIDEAIAMASRDFLTKFQNRNDLHRIAKAYLAHENAQATLLLIDVDDFKKANDVGGHDFGDRILMKAADILRSTFPDDLIVRFGGDEFCVFMYGINDRKTIENKLKSLMKKTGIIFASDSGREYRLSFSVGVAAYPNYGRNLHELYVHADDALYKAKELGKNTYFFYRNLHNTKVLNDIFKYGFRDSDCKKILDSFVEFAIYVVSEEDHRILFYNRKMKELAPDIEIGMLCCDAICGDGSHGCPLKQLGDANTISVVRNGTLPGQNLIEVRATRFLWRDETPAVMLGSMPYIPDAYETEHALPNNSAIFLTNDKGSSTDHITGAFTRKGFIEYMEGLPLRGIHASKYAVLYINIRGFKFINGTFGSVAGDELLRYLYLRIMSSKLAPAVGARNLADQFIFLVEQRDLDFDVLRSVLDFSWNYNNRSFYIHCRCGIYVIDNSQVPAYIMIDKAKLAKDFLADEYATPYIVYDENMNTEYIERISLLSNFETAMKNHRFDVYYQPVIDAKSGKVVSAEALVRWHSLEYGVIHPDIFIPTLEKFGYITRLDKYVSRDVVDFLSARYHKGLPVVPVSINLSRNDLLDDDSIMQTISTLLKESGLPNELLSFEITESSDAHVEERLREFIKFLHGLGAKIYLDDFGNGFSSFDMIEKYDLDIVKIDKSFIKKLLLLPKSRLLVEHIIRMSHQLGLEVIAEGVETEEELNALRDLQCDYIQGFYFSKPLSQEEFAKYLEEHM